MKSDKSDDKPKSSTNQKQYVSVLQSFRFRATFVGYTNGSHSKMYVEHNQNGIYGENNHFIPAIIEVNFCDLVEQAKQLAKGTEIELVVHRKQSSTGLAAEVIDIKPLKLKPYPTTTKNLKPLHNKQTRKKKS